MAHSGSCLNNSHLAERVQLYFFAIKFFVFVLKFPTQFFPAKAAGKHSWSNNCVKYALYI